MRSPRTTPLGLATAVLTLTLALAIAACQEAAPPDPKLGILTSPTDSLATLAEIRVSLAGETAPGADTYSYRGFYAGMSRGRIEEKVPGARPPNDTTGCHPATRVPAELVCARDAVLGTDRAMIHLDITYAAPSATGARVAREIILTRQLPLNVDGVRVAGALADAFEKQTTLLDSRDQSYGRHQAHIRMGTLNGSRTHYAEVTVASHGGREELTVKMGRGAR